MKKNSIQEVREYWNRRPCNISHSIEELGTKEYFDQVERRKYFVEPHIPIFANFEQWNAKKVLEIGCGIGTDTINFLRAGAQVTAVDLSEKSLEIVQQRIQTFGFSAMAKLYQANVEELSKIVPIEQYDLIYSFGVLHHTPHPERAIEELKKYLAPGGILKIMLYNKFSWKVFWIGVKFHRFYPDENLDDLVARYSEAQTGCPVTYTYTKKSVKQLLNGFKIQNISLDHIFPYKIEPYKIYHYQKVWYFNIIPMPAFRMLEKMLGWHICITAIRQ